MGIDKDKLKEDLQEEVKEEVQKEEQNAAEQETQDQAEQKEAEETTEKSEVEILHEEVQKKEDRYVRLFAEFENYKRRTSKERVALFKTANEEVMQAILPVLDDFDRALKELDKSEHKKDLEGIELIVSKLIKSLKDKGLEEMKVKKGDKFDADLHEAVTQIPAPKKKLKGKVVDVIEKGYVLGEKIIRYPKVVTGA